MKIRFGRLKFEPSLEREFIRDYNINSLSFIRLALLLVIVLYGLFGILDIWILPATRNIAWIIRFGIVIPFLTAMIALSYVKQMHRYIQAALLIMGVITGGGIVAMIAFAEEHEPGYSFYYAGLMLVIFGIYTILRLRFYFAIISSLAVVAVYEYVAVFVNDMTAGGLSNPKFLVFMNNNFFFISSAVVGMFASFTLEYYIREVFQQRKIIDEDRKRIGALLDTFGKELALARIIQRSIMPGVPPSIDGAVVTVIYRPMEELGGDFYDFIPLGNGKMGFFISDVSGHGIPAALVTGILKSLVSSAGEAAGVPGAMMKYINRGIKDLSSGDFVTACYCILDMRNMELVYARAGHPYPLLIRGSETISLESRGNFLGRMISTEFETKSERLRSGDRILLYTDGLSEARNSAGEEFEKYLHGEVFPMICGTDLPLLGTIYDRLVSFRSNDRFDDDICLIGIDIR